MVVTVTWYVTEVWKSGGSWTRDNPNDASTTLTQPAEVKVWFGKQTEWDILSSAQKASYDLHIIDLVSGNTNPDLVNANELRTGMLEYNAAYSIANNSGYLGTTNIDIDGDPLTPPVPSVALAIDGTSITSSNHALIITLDPITVTSITPAVTYQGGVGHFDPFLPNKLRAPCFTRGTMILTVEGEKPVEALAKGDLVLTADCGPQPVTLVMSSVLTEGQLARQPELRPIRIRAGALGLNSPVQDLLVSPQHRMLVRSKIARHIFGEDEILVAAKQLLCIDGVDIEDAPGGVEYFHIVFDRHQVVFANGAASESLYTGPEGLRGLAAALREEVFKLFPELRSGVFAPVPARLMVTGRMGRKLAWRHAQQGRAFVC